jgi:MFS family permease
MSDYWREFRTEWRAVPSTTSGLAFGLIMMSYAISIMGPHLIKEFGWARVDLVKVQMLSLISVVAYPLVGRLADTITARRTALIGVIASPLLFLGLSMVRDLHSNAILFVAQSVVLGATTPPVCRIIVQRFRLARGLALSIAVAGPSLIAAVGGPLINNFVVDNGWHAGYLVLAVTTLIGGDVAILLMPPDRIIAVQSGTARPQRLCTDPAQSCVLDAEWGRVALHFADGGAAYPDGPDRRRTWRGRQGGLGDCFGLCHRHDGGAPCQRFRARQTACEHGRVGTLVLSAAGLFVMSRHGVPMAALAVAVMAVGLSFGAESDIVGHLISRIIPIKNYGAVFGIISSTITVSTGVGAAIVAALLNRYDSYSPFLMLPRSRADAEDIPSPADQAVEARLGDRSKLTRPQGDATTKTYALF